MIGLVFLILANLSIISLKKTEFTRFFRFDRTLWRLLLIRETLPVPGEVSPPGDGEGK